MEMRETGVMDVHRVEAIAQKGIARAEKWQNRANELLTHEEKGIQEQMHRLLTHPTDKVVLTKMIDQSFRPHSADRVADQVNSILKEYGMPDFFSMFEIFVNKSSFKSLRALSSVSI